ncbi:MAG: hypothetical protein M0P13_08740 [Fibrobacteraceae bacterium]|nr:hypothetical protein [Fibrobacteraceae bacterium]
MRNFYISTNIYLSQNTLDTSSGIKFSPRKSSHKIIQTQSGFSISGLQNENVSLYQVNGCLSYHSTGLSGNANFPICKKGGYLVRIGKVSQLVVFK